jgi:hypothetical protein
MLFPPFIGLLGSILRRVFLRSASEQGSREEFHSLRHVFFHGLLRNTQPYRHFLLRDVIDSRSIRRAR